MSRPKKPLIIAPPAPRRASTGVPLLDEMVDKYSIPDWPYEASFDRIIVYSVPEDKASRDTFVKGGVIRKVEARKEHEKDETPRGVIVSAGLVALDHLHSHGLGLGHMLWLARLSPWRHEVEKDKDGKDIEFLFLRSGDIVGSETLLEAIKAGRARVVRDQNGKHRYEFSEEKPRERYDAPSFAA